LTAATVAISACVAVKSEASSLIPQKSQRMKISLTFLFFD